MKVLFHLCVDENNHPMEAAFTDGNGRKWVIPYGKPTKFESDYLASRIVEHLTYYGMVEVATIDTDSGIKYDMEDAQARALDCLRVSEDACVADYIRLQLEDRIRANFPPLPPVGRQLTCVIKQKTNLLKYGIRPIGWEPPYHMEEVNVGSRPVGGAGLEETVRQLQTQLLQQSIIINELLTGRLKSQSQSQSQSQSKTEAATGAAITGTEAETATVDKDSPTSGESPAAKPAKKAAPRGVAQSVNL